MNTKIYSSNMSYTDDSMINSNTISMNNDGFYNYKIYTTNPADTITLTGLQNNYANQSLHVTGDAEFEGDITIKGVKLSERLDKIEERLAILRPNSELEDRWNQLKQIGEDYRKLEKEILDKEKVWDIIKK